MNLEIHATCITNKNAYFAVVVGVTTPTTVWLRMAVVPPAPADLLPLPGSDTERNRFVMRAQLVVTSYKS